MPEDPSGRFAVNLIENEANELLMLKRSAVNRIAAGLWGFPSGHIEPDETPEECARRELIEEIGPHVQVSLLGRAGPVTDRIEGRLYHFHLFHFRWLDGEIRLNEEHTEFAWIAKEDFHSYEVMRGAEIDIGAFGIWPHAYLQKA